MDQGKARPLLIPDGCVGLVERFDDRCVVGGLVVLKPSLSTTLPHGRPDPHWGGGTINSNAQLIGDFPARHRRNRITMGAYTDGIEHVESRPSAHPSDEG